MLWLEIPMKVANIWNYTCGLTLALIRYALSIEFPNQITGTPTVDCQQQNVKLSVKTTSGNPSHLYVKGRSNEPACVTRNSDNIAIPHEQCGLLSPPGVFYKVCIVVQLHPQFMTKVDRTFCASCFYQEAVKDITQELGVSLMSSTEVAVSFPMPTCTYTIRRGSPTGAEIRFATVGEPVVHVWSCPSESYGMLVQNCFVDDGQGNRILIIDQNGCGVDRYIIQTPNYSEDLVTAFQESHVFKFADKTVTRFTCQIKVCIKAGGSCVGITPPKNCPIPTTSNLGTSANPQAFQRHRPKRRQIEKINFTAIDGPSLMSDFNDDFMDLTQELIVFEDELEGATMEPLNNGHHHKSFSLMGSVCLTTTSFIIMIGCLSVMILMGFGGTIVCWCKGTTSVRRLKS